MATLALGLTLMGLPVREVAAADGACDSTTRDCDSAPAGPYSRLQAYSESSEATVHAQESPAGPYNYAYRVSDREAYQDAKARAAKEAPSRNGAASTPDSSEPLITRSWEGIFDPGGSPSDTTAAIGPTRFVQMVNARFAIYDRNNDFPVSTGTLQALTGDLTGRVLTDPQIIWDPDTSRFYYVVLNADCVFFADASCLLDVGFSTTDSPNTAPEWCKYFIDAGPSTIPDFPKLGDTQDFWLVGVNRFTPTSAGADVIWITKPPPGPACPDPSAFLAGAQLDLQNADGTPAMTPVPVNQVDPNSTGWVLATPDLLTSPAGLGDFISVFRVTRNPDGTANVQRPATALSVPGYAIPPNAPQAGTGFALDTLDGRLTQAVSAFDPSRSAEAIWTQHAVLGGAGAMIRWYEIGPSPLTLLQSGAVEDAGLYVFNGAISPDRVVNGATRVFGDSLVLGFNTSSPTTSLAIQTISKIGEGAQSAFVAINSSSGPSVDELCDAFAKFCRWGDYAGASPDPAASPTASHGQVWLTNSWSVSGANQQDVDWRTWNWAAQPTEVRCPGFETAPGTHIVGTAGSDNLVGTAGDDVICGLDGSDVINGAEGNDLILGGGGDDSLSGGDGADRLFGGDGADRLWGLAGADVLYGNLGADVLRGGAGADSLVGGDGDDVLVGEADPDRMYGQGGADRLFARDGTRDPRVDGGTGVDTCSVDAFDVVVSC